jgi:hypothetical protein
MSLFYVPSWVEWAVTIGVLSLGGLVFTVAVLILPLREKAADGTDGGPGVVEGGATPSEDPREAALGEAALDTVAGS